MVLYTVLTEADWITAIPYSSCNSPTGTHVVSPQYVALVTSIGGGCTYKCLLVGRSHCHLWCSELDRCHLKWRISQHQMLRVLVMGGPVTTLSVYSLGTMCGC